MTTIAELHEQKTQLIAYMTSKIKATDWHAVQDAASDIREIDAKLNILREQSEHSTPDMVYSIDDDRIHPIVGYDLAGRNHA